MKTERIYPESVEEGLDTLMDALNYDALNELGDPVDLSILRSQFGEVLFQRWLDGDDSLSFEQEAASNVLKTAVAKTAIYNMKKNGLIDIIDDGSGNEYVFLTEKGMIHDNEYLQYINN